jgi:hypothetical protein
MHLKAFPELFSLGTKSNFGLPLEAHGCRVLAQRVKFKAHRMMCDISPQINDPHINYLNFDTAIRERNDLKMIFYDNLMDLKHRKLVDWIDIDNIWKSHMNKRGNHSDALMVLASLEVHLKAQNR